MPVSLVIVPALWGFVRGSAAVLLNVPTNEILVAAGVLVTITELIRATRLARAMH